MLKRICSIYRCSKKEGMYIYVDKEKGTAHLPEPLLKQIGKTELAMTLVIKTDSKLARANAQDVLVAIEEKGFYLQMPPSLHELSSTSDMQQVRNQNSKL